MSLFGWLHYSITVIIIVQSKKQRIFHRTRNADAIQTSKDKIQTKYILQIILLTQGKVWLT